MKAELQGVGSPGALRHDVVPELSQEQTPHQRLACGLSALAIAWAGCSVQYMATTHERTTPTVCPAVPAEAIAAVNDLLDRPKDPLVSQARRQTYHMGRDSFFGTVIVPDQSDEHQATANWHVKQTVAQASGVTVFDARPYLNQLEADSRPNSITPAIVRPYPGLVGTMKGGARTRAKDPAPYHLRPHLPIETYLKQARAFLGLYGIRLDVGHAGEHFEDGVKAPTWAELNTDDARSIIEEVMVGVSDMPREYVHDVAGIRRIVLVAHGDTSGYYHREDNTIAVNISYDPQTEEGVVTHEGEHAADAEVCEGAQENDPQYSALNMPGLYAQEETKYKGRPELNMDAVNALVARYTPIILRDKAFGHFAAACRLSNELVGHSKQAQIVEPYGAASIEEDKANTLARLSYPISFGNLVDRQFPVVRYKAALLLARVWMLAPGVVKFWNAMGYKYQSDQAVFDCKTMLSPSMQAIYQGKMHSHHHKSDRSSDIWATYPELN